MKTTKTEAEKTIDQRAQEYYNGLVKPLADERGLAETAYCMGALDQQRIERSVYAYSVNKEEKQMKIYIASSWKNQHGVEMLTALLREQGHEVISWVENNYGEDHNHVTKKFQFEEWVNSSEANQSFIFDTDGATKSDLVIYYAPSGQDACAELGAAWAKGVPTMGLAAKGEGLGLMRKLVDVWYVRYTDLLVAVKRFHKDWSSAKLEADVKRLTDAL